jgi:hypothetical protein
MFFVMEYLKGKDLQWLSRSGVGMLKSVDIGGSQILEQLRLCLL